MPDRFFERSILITPETIFLQLKSIWCGIFEHSAAEKIWCTRTISGTTETIFLRLQRIFR